MQKKKNWPAKIGIAITIFLCLWAILRFTNTLQYYSISTSGNSPTINTGDIIWGSRFKTLQRGNFIAFKTYDSLAGRVETWTKRCVGMPGDTVEMKSGILFVNGENVDKNYILNNDYVIFTRHPQKFIDSLQLIQKDENNFQQTDSFLQTILSTTQYKKAQSIIVVRQDSIMQFVYPDNASFPLPFFVKLGETTWTMDNFGPLAVPYNHYFVLGDNRHSSMDSRYIGFIKKENYVATILGK